MVTAGYVLFKAPNTTQLSWYTQFLRSVLPDTAPYFDVVRFKKTPMDQLIPHLRIQCGEKHVTPLCQALLPVLTGRGSALFLPRYALGTMTDEKIKSHFQFHEKWARSLKAITMSPQVNHLDQQRTEYNEDGTTVERSTREWMSTILAPDKASPALCDVVNGLPDHKAYLLVPSHYHAFVQQAWRNYKSRLYPPNHREARFRDTLPGLMLSTFKRKSSPKYHFLNNFPGRQSGNKMAYQQIIRKLPRAVYTTRINLLMTTNHWRVVLHGRPQPKEFVNQQVATEKKVPKAGLTNTITTLSRAQEAALP
ncbi:hypothetical protein MHU86_17368 [Fragilaria crotonensis]|nr:hypothetical protein MHU86_17368 [Fragilaria crotonensis]